MAGRKRLCVFWDPAIKAAMRRAMEVAFVRLVVDSADGERVDIGDTPQWKRLVNQLRTKLGMASLASRPNSWRLRWM